MAETGTSVVDTPQTPEQIQAANNKAELDTMMKINLNGGIVPDELLKPDTTTGTNVDGPKQDPPPTITFESIKEKFGYESPELAIKEIEELRALRTTPPKTEPIKFENEDSEKLFKAFTKGDKKEIFNILEKHERLESIIKSEVSKDNAADIIKLKIKLEDKENRLSNDDIDFHYKEQYSAPKEPKEPVQRGSETDDEFKDRHDDWQEAHNDWKERVASVEQRKIVAAKMAIPHLEKYKSELKFPEITDTIDEGYTQYKKSLDEQPAIAEAMQEIYKPFTPKSLEVKIPFADETNKIGFEYQYEPDVESFNRSKEMVVDAKKFMDSFKTPDGKFDELRYFKAIDFALNADKYLFQAMNQAKNATIKALIPDNSGGTQRQFPQSQQPNEVDQMMQLHGIKRAS